MQLAGAVLVALWLAQSPRPMDAIEFKSLQGNVETLSRYNGKIVVLNFWATWCQPCKKEMPLLAELERRYRARGVQFIGASVDDIATLRDVPGFVREYGIEFPIWTASSEQQAALRLATAVPATLIIDRDGRSVFRIIGEADRTVLAERLEWLLSDRSSPLPPEMVLPVSITPEHFREHELGLEDEHEEEEEEAGSEVPS